MAGSTMTRLYRAPYKLRATRRLRIRSKLTKYKTTSRYRIPRVPKIIPNVFPDRYACTMRYNDQFYTTADSTGMPYVIFKYNDVYDPMGTISAFSNNRGIGGHQPYGYDQITQLYSRYIVTKVIVMISASVTGSNSKITMRANRDTSGSTGNMELDWERGDCKSIYPTSGGGPKFMKMTIYPHKQVGIPFNDYIASDIYGADITVTNSPTSLLYLPIHASNDDGGNTSQKYYLDVKLIFTVIWSDPNVFAQS